MIVRRSNESALDAWATRLRPVDLLGAPPVTAPQVMDATVSGPEVVEDAPLSMTESRLATD